MGRLDDTRTEGRLLLLAADFLTLLPLTAGTALSWLSVAYLPLHPRMDLGAVIAFCLAASAVSAAVFSWRHGLWAALALAAADGFALRRLWERLAEDWPLDRAPDLPDLVEKYPEALFLLYALAALLLGFAAVKARRWYLAAGLTLLPVLPAILGGTLPMWGAMLAAFAGWGALLLTALFGRRDPGSLGRARLLALAGMLALTLGLTMALPEEGYLRPQWATNARNSLILGARRRLERYFDLEALESGPLADLGLDLSVPEGDGPGGSAAPEREVPGSSGGGTSRREDLLAAGPLRYEGRRVLSLRSSLPGGERLYLRGGSFGTYTGESWETVQDVLRPDLQPALYPAGTAPGGTERTLTVRDFRFRGVYYYPYRLTEGWGETDEAGWLALPDSGEWMDNLVTVGAEEYRVGYVPGGPEEGFVPLDGLWAAEEELYRNQDAYQQTRSSPFEEAYLQVPEELRPVLLEVLEQAGETETDPRFPEQFREPAAAAARTAETLAALAAYDPDTPAMEPGEDFVTRFLAEGRGYCVHFATAGTLLLRAQGVPARYVTGYAARLNSRGTGDALDSDAHAWVEIYLDGYGWYPVEMTPGGAGGEPADGPNEETSGGGGPGPGEDSEPPDGPAGEGPDGTLPEEEPPEGLEAGEPAAAPRRAVRGLALALAALCAVYGAALLARRLERRDGDANRSVLRAYVRYRRVLRWGGGEDGTLETLGRKARFSQHVLTEEERETAWRCLEQAGETAKKGGKQWKRWALSLLGPFL